MKSAELTGMWEKKLRDIEKGEYDMDQFKKELFEMVAGLVHEVKYQPIVEQPTLCPKCGKGKVISGKSAWGCSDWKNGCKFKLPFEFKGAILSDREMKSLLESGVTRYRYPLKVKGKDVKEKIALNSKLKLEIHEEAKAETEKS